MNKKEIAKEFTRQMLDQNTPSINFEQVTTMLKQIEQTHQEVLNNMESYRTKHRTLSFSFTDHHSQLNLSEQQLQRLTGTLSEQLTELSTRFSKYLRSSRLKGYLTPITTDSNRDGNNRGAGNEPPAFALATAGKDMVDRELKEKQRKKRRGLRR